MVGPDWSSGLTSEPRVGYVSNNEIRRFCSPNDIGHCSCNQGPLVGKVGEDPVWVIAIWIYW